MDHHAYPDGYVLWEDGVIHAVGPMTELTEIDPNALDAEGALLLPGFIDAHCHIGMWEDGLGFEGDDGNEDTEPVTPQLRAIDAVNPLDRCFTEALESGITTVVTGPGSANPIGGSWLAMKTDGRRIDEMLVKEPVGMKFALGENPKSSYHTKDSGPATRMATAALIREQLYKAKRYLADKQLHENQPDEYDAPEYDIRCEALIPVLTRQVKAFFHAHRADDIFTALRLSREFHLDCVIVHGTDGHLVADILAKEGAQVITGPLLCDRSKPELRELTPRNPAALSAAGVKVAICTDHPVIPIQYLRLSAALAVAEGLDTDMALRAITIDAAKICGLDDRIGSITVGKEADFVLFARDDDPLSFQVKPQAVFVRGRLAAERGRRV